MVSKCSVKHIVISILALVFWRRVSWLCTQLLSVGNQIIILRYNCAHWIVHQAKHLRDLNPRAFGEPGPHLVPGMSEHLGRVFKVV